MRARFATSPLWEATAALRVLAAGRHAFHGPWLTATRTALAQAGVRLPTLSLLVPPSGHMADLLTPAPTARSTTIDAELDRVRDAPLTDVIEDLRHLTASATGRRREALLSATTAPERLLQDAVSELTLFVRLAVVPSWPRLQALADADIAYRGRRIAEVGTSRALSELHPRMQVDGTDVLVRTACLDEPLAASADELVLVPTSFTWPDPLVLNHPAHPLTVAYAPRGIGGLWASPRATDGLAELAGSTRAHALRLLDIPMTTTDLAAQLALSAPTVSEHLQILARAGAVEPQREGRRVYYARTGLGEALVTGSTQDGDPRGQP